MTLTHGSLFSGLGGFDLPAEWMGWTNVFHCEKDKFCTKILKYYWPLADHHYDIKTTDFRAYRGRIDVLTGGFPCQGFSVAGQRKGTEDPRYLWPPMLRAIREIQPRWVIAENVRGLLSMRSGLVFEQIVTDLESEGYEVFPLVLPAAGVGAPHRRERVFIIAYAAGFGSRKGVITEGGIDKRELRGEKEENGSDLRSETDRRSGATSDSNGDGYRRELGEDGKAEGEGIGEGHQRERDRDNASGTSEQGIASDSLRRKRLERRVHSVGPPKARRHVSELHSRHPRSTWGNFPTQWPVHSRNDGLSNRLDGITLSSHRRKTVKASGNAVVPQVALQIFRAIEGCEKTKIV
jgi:DNA (cytosine-5)-methyltransferase 1